MITALIFFGHLVFSLIVFTKKWQDEKLSAGFMNIALIGILFAVGWSISGMIAKALMEPKGFGLFFDSDTFSLVILTIGEYLFYRMYYSNLFTEGDKGKQ
jgi:hypothetical protein